MKKNIVRQINRIAHLIDHNHHKEAQQLCLKMIKNGIRHPDIHFLLGESLLFRHYFEDACQAFEQALRLNPQHTGARIDLILCYKEMGQLNKSVDICQPFLEHPNSALESFHAFLLLRNICAWHKADLLQDKVVSSLKHGDIPAQLVSNSLISMNEIPGLSSEDLFQMHRQWGRMVTRQVKASKIALPYPKAPDKKIKIAYLSVDFNKHPVGFFSLPVILNHDRERFEVFCYARLIRDDEYTAKFRLAADHFIDITALSTAQTAERIAKDGIHILIDLSGHTGQSPIEVMAFKPAPVQISYLGYPNTTGLDTVDFRITDQHCDPENGTQYVEELLKMPSTFLCVSNMPDVYREEPSPVESNGFITFGSFNDIRKINPTVIKAWAEIMSNVKNSKIIIKSRDCEQSIVCDNILLEFKQHGIKKQRVEFLPYLNAYQDHAAIMRRVDIALDTFPYCGTHTTCDTLWMGLPVITLEGDTHVQRVSASILKCIGFEATIARSIDEYITKAIDLASRPENLSFLHHCIHQLFQNSLILHPEKVTRQLEELYLEACRKKDIQLPKSIESQALPDICLTMPDDITIVLPKKLENKTTYILAEQGDWHEDEIRFLRSISQPGMRVLDLQAGYGCYALSLAQRSGDNGAVLAITSNADEAHCLAKSAKLNHFHWLSTTTEPQQALPFLQDGIDLLIAEQPDLLTSKLLDQLNGAPLIMLHPTETLANTNEYIEQMQSQSFTAFRFIPGLNLLVPYAESFAPEQTAQPIFFCPAERANALAAKGDLAQQIATSLNLPDDIDYWQKPIEPCTFATELLDIWKKQVAAQQTSNDWESVRNALTAYAMAHNGNITPNERFGFLCAAFSLLLNTPELQSCIPRLCTVARIANELGNTEATIQALQMAIEGIKVTQTFVPSEPFLPVAKCYDQTNSDNNLAEWVLAQLLAQIQLLQYSPSFSNQSILQETAATLQNLGFPNHTINQRIDSVQTLALEINKYELSFTTTNPKRWSNQVVKNQLQWKQNPDDIIAIDHLKQLRLSFAEFCLSIDSNSELTSVLENGADKGVQALINNDLKYEPLTDEEQHVIDVALQTTDVANYGSMMVSMFFFQPHTMPIQFENIISLPEPILDLFLDFIASPPSFSQIGEAEQYFRCMDAWVTHLYNNFTPSSHPRWKKIVHHFTFNHNFVPLYMNSCNLKGILVKRAKIMGRLLEKEGHTLDYSFENRPRSNKRIKISFLSNGYRSMTEATSTLTCFKHIDRTRFEIILLSMEETGSKLEMYCRKFADTFIHLKGTIQEIAETIRQQNLDILYLGTGVAVVTHQTSLLALFRLARVQIASGCSAGTTGMPYYDYFLSGQYIEPEKDAQSYYSEKLILMEGSHHCYDFSFKTSSRKANVFVSREKLNIPETAIIYTAGACCYKITPELEDTWLRIIASVPNAYLVLYPFNPNWTDSYAVRAFSTRIRKGFEKYDIKNRLRLLNISGQENVREVVKLADIYLDSFPFSGPTSLLDPLETGVPPVAINGNNFRSMASGGLLKELCMPELIANDVSDYVNIATQLGTNKKYRNSLKYRIKDAMRKRPPFLNVEAFGERMSNIFEKIASTELAPKG